MLSPHGFLPHHKEEPKPKQFRVRVAPVFASDVPEDEHLSLDLRRSGLPRATSTRHDPLPLHNATDPRLLAEQLSAHHSLRQRFPGSSAASAHELQLQLEAPQRAQHKSFTTLLPGDTAKQRLHKLRRKLQQRGSLCLLSPSSPAMRYWDMVTAVLLCYTAVVTPYEVSFLQPHINTLFFINRIVDLAFATDLVLQFFTAYLDTQQGTWVTSHWQIARHYLRGMFALDVVSIMPFDLISIVVTNPAVSKLKAVRLLRLLRLSKLLRVMKAGRIMQRLEAMAVVSYTHLQMGRFLLLVIVLAHWMACAFHMVVVVEARLDHSWVLAYNKTGGNDSMDSAPAVYLAALYWATMTMTTIGYGDIAPQTSLERAFEILGMLFGASVFAYLVGSVCGLVASMGRRQAEFYELMDELSGFMHDRRMPTDLQFRIREFFHFRHNNKTADDCRTLFMYMSPALRAEATCYMHAKAISSMALFRRLPEDMLIEMALALRSEIYTPHEIIFREGDECSKLLVVEKGVVAARNALLTSGTVVGSDGFFVPGSHWRYQAVTLSYCVIYTLKAATFYSILERYPDCHSMVGRACKMYSLRHSFIFYARAVRAILHARSQQRRYHLPMASDLGGRHITLQQYQRIVTLLHVVDPEGMGVMGDAATRIQAAYRGFKARRRWRMLVNMRPWEHRPLLACAPPTDWCIPAAFNALPPSACGPSCGPPGTAPGPAPVPLSLQQAPASTPCSDLPQLQQEQSAISVHVQHTPRDAALALTPPAATSPHLPSHVDPDPDPQGPGSLLGGLGQGAGQAASQMPRRLSVSPVQQPSFPQQPAPRSWDEGEERSPQSPSEQAAPSARMHPGSGAAGAAGEEAPGSPTTPTSAAQDRGGNMGSMLLRHKSALGSMSMQNEQDPAPSQEYDVLRVEMVKVRSEMRAVADEVSSRISQLMERLNTVGTSDDLTLFY